MTAYGKRRRAECGMVRAVQDTRANGTAAVAEGHCAAWGTHARRDRLDEGGEGHGLAENGRQRRRWGRLQSHRGPSLVHCLRERGVIARRGQEVGIPTIDGGNRVT